MMSAPKPTWREMTSVDEEAPIPDGSADVHEEIDLDDLGVHEEPVDSVTRLVAEKRASADSAGFESKVDALLGYETGHLVLRIHTCPDALMLWEIHKELDRRGLPPALRWPANNDSVQMKFVTTLADIYWVAVHTTDHVPLFKGWRQLFKLTPGSDPWLDKAYWLLMNMKGSNLSRHGTKALALDDNQRLELMMFPSTKMATARKELSPKRFQEIRDNLLSDAVANQDKAGWRKPDELANHRAQLLRVSVLSGHSPTVTSKNWELLMGKNPCPGA